MNKNGRGDWGGGEGKKDLLEGKVSVGPVWGMGGMGTILTGVACVSGLRWLCNFRIFVKLSNCIFIDGECFRISRASLMASLYLSLAFAMIFVF